MLARADFLISDEMIASKAETAAGTLRHIADKYGGARGYARAIGLSDAEVHFNNPLASLSASSAAMNLHLPYQT